MPSSPEAEEPVFTIDIHPAPFPDVSKAEQFKRAQALADELGKIEGFADVKLQQVNQRSGAALNAFDPLITVAIITSGMPPALTALFDILRKKRTEKDHQKTVIHIENITFMITSRNEAKMKKEIEKLVWRKNKKD